MFSYINPNSPPFAALLLRVRIPRHQKPGLTVVSWCPSP